MTRGVVGALGASRYKSDVLRFSNADLSGYEKIKWIANLNNWMVFVGQDMTKPYFDKRLEHHELKLKHSRELVSLIEKDDHIAIVKKCKSMIDSYKCSPSQLDELVLIPLGKQVLGALMQGVELQDLSLPSGTLNVINFQEVMNSGCMLM